MKGPFSLLQSWLGRRIQNKILFSVLAVFIVVYGATLNYIYTSTKADLLEAARRQAQSTAEMLALTLYRNYELEEDIRKIQIDILSAKKSKSDIMEINVFDRNLEILSSTNDENLFTAVEGEIYASAVRNKAHIKLFTEVGEPYLNIVYPVSAGANEAKYVATGGLEVQTSLKDQFEYLARILVNTVVAGIVILVAIGAVITLISHSITKPIQNLYSGMSRVDHDGDLQVQVPVVSEDEVGYLTSTFNHMIDTVRVSNEKLVEMIESSRRFVPEQFLSALGRGDITDVNLGDAILRNMSVFFMDIRNFTDMSERMSAEENLIFLNSLLTSILPAIERNHGFIDKYMGDCIMALFERPDDALLAAVSLRREMIAYNRGRSEEGVENIDVGIGINSGELILGTMGSSSRIDTTVIGSTVNVASRLESLTKEYEVPIIVTDAVYRRLADSTRASLDVKELGRVKIRGVENEVELIGVLG